MGDTVMNSTESPESMFRSVGDAEVSLDEMLSLACRQGKQDIVELLLESGAKVNYRNKAGNTPLLEACSQGHVNIARLLLEKKADIDAPTETTSDSALTWACTLGNEEIVQLLLEHKAYIEHRTRDGCTALMFAALAGHDRVAKLLLGNSAELNVESDSNKDSPLTFACWKGHQKVVELFLVHGANIEHRTKEGFSPLMFAALGGHTEVARLLLEKCAEVNQPSGSNNDIPLTSACWKGHHDVVELLLCYQSNIEHHTKDGCTPLMLAAREGHLTVAQLLLNHNARVNVPSGSENNIPLTLACWKGHKDVVELLLHYKSNIEHQNKAGCTPLMLAAREGHYEATELLLDHCANLNIPSGSNDDTPLTLACWKGHDDVVCLLLERQSCINHQTKTGCTPLMEATREGHITVAKMLLEAGADVETPDNYGQTPFFMACWKGHAEVANLLLEYGANKDCKTKTGITPFFQACRENHVEVVKLLLDYGCNPSTPFPNSRECPLTLAAEKGFTELTQVLLSRSANVECRTKKGCTPLFLTCKEGFKEIAIMLTKHGAETESSDHRGVTPLLAAFKNGYVEVVDWLLGHVTHLPSDLECQKALMAPRMSDKDVFPQRSKCLELIMKAKKAREQAALKNAQILFEEIDAEKEKKELRKKAVARKKAKRKERKRKGQGTEKTVEPQRDFDDDDDYDEEEEIGTIKNTQEYNSGTNHAQSDDEEVNVQSKNRKKLKNKNKRLIQNSTQISSQPVSLVTDIHRTNPQSPNQVAAESFEDEESEDDMFVDAPEFPESKSLSYTSERMYGNSDRTSQDSSPTVDLNRLSKRPPKSLLKNQKGKNDDSRSTSNTTRNNSRLTLSNRNQTDLNSGGSSRDSNRSKDKRTQVPRARSTEDANDKLRSKSSLTKLVNRSDSPISLTNRSMSTSSTGTRGSYVACVDNEEDENESWNIQLEPGSDWNNSDDRNEGFKSQNPTRIKSWSSVSTAPASTTTNMSSNATTPTQSSSSNGSVNSKPWHEVSRAITTFQMTVSNSLVGRIIGKKGLKINQIQADSGAQISISRAIPRSVDRLITIKGTERSVKTAQDLIEEALSTPSKDIDIIPTENDKPANVPMPTKTQSASSQPVVNPWNQTQPTALVWGQKRYSDVVPPTISLLKQGPGNEDKTTAQPPSRRTSLPSKIPSYNHQNSTPNNKPDNRHPPIDTPTITTATPISVSPTPTDTKDDAKQHSVPTVHPRHSVTLHALSSVKEREEDEDTVKEEAPKQKRSLSDPLVMTKPSLSVVAVNRDTSSITTTTKPTNNVAASLSTPLVTISPTPGTSPLGDSDSIDGSTSVIPKVTSAPSVGVTVTTQDVSAPRTTRTVGIVTPTQSVKLFQHDTTSSYESSITTTNTTNTSTTDHLTLPTPSGTFGAIGPPRRSSLPVSTGNHYVENNSPRKLSYAGMHLNNPHYGGSLGMVPESYSMNQLREFPWTPNAPPPHPPPPPPPTCMSPVNLWNNHGGSMEWSGGGVPPTHEYEQRMRSQSWAGLGPSGAGAGGFPNHHHHHHPIEYPPGSFQPHNHMPPQGPPPPPAHMHSQWGKYHAMGHNHRPPSYNVARPHSSMSSFHPTGGGFNCSNYGNEERFRDNHHQQQVDFNRGQQPHPSNYPPHCHYSSPSSTSQPSINDTSSPLSLRQVLGDLEREIFPGGTPAMDFLKDDLPSISKRWSISAVPPNIPSNQEQQYRYQKQGSVPSSVWDNANPSLRHSVSSPFCHNQQEPDQPLISDLAASWPIWTSPTPDQRSSQSSFFPANSTGNNDKGWSSNNTGHNPITDLADLMKRLDIEEHIPTLQNRGINLERLLSMSDEEWRDMLPMVSHGTQQSPAGGPRVKLMNAINLHLQGETALTGGEVDKSSSFLSNTDETSKDKPTGATTHKCSPFVQ